MRRDHKESTTDSDHSNSFLLAQIDDEHRALFAGLRTSTLPERLQREWPVQLNYILENGENSIMESVYGSSLKDCYQRMLSQAKEEVLMNPTLEQNQDIGYIV